MEEIWKDIAGYENLYQVSNLGNVKTVKQNKILKQHISVHGYLRCRMRKNNKTKKFVVHRLVAKAFIPNPENKPCVDHIDTNKQNNNVKNLRWVTYSENMKNPITIKAMNKYKYKKVRCLENGEIFNSIREASKKIGATLGALSAALRLSHKCKGLTFKYFQENAIGNQIADNLSKQARAKYYALTKQK